MNGSTKQKQNPVVIVKNSVDDKVRQGDLCTREGNFKYEPNIITGNGLDSYG